MTGSRKKNKPHHPSQKLPTYRQMSRVVASQNEFRRRFDEMRKQGESSTTADGTLKRSPSSYDLSSKDEEPEKTEKALKANLIKYEDEPDEEAEGFLIVQLPGGLEAPLVDSNKTSQNGKTAEGSTQTDEAKPSRGFWPWST